LTNREFNYPLHYYTFQLHTCIFKYLVFGRENLHTLHSFWRENGLCCFLPSPFHTCSKVSSRQSPSPALSLAWKSSAQSSLSNYNNPSSPSTIFLLERQTAQLASSDLALFLAFPHKCFRAFCTSLGCSRLRPLGNSECL